MKNKPLFNKIYLFILLGKLVSVILSLMKIKFKEKKNPDKIIFFLLEMFKENTEYNW